MKDTAITNAQYYINMLADAVHRNAKEHGWWDEDRGGAECIALMHSELSEALEAQRNTSIVSEWEEAGDSYTLNGRIYDRPADKHLPHLPNEAVELADCIIRILDYAVARNLPVVAALFDKHEYNKQRPYKHGKEF
jgi:hypothetical protein